MKTATIPSNSTETARQLSLFKEEGLSGKAESPAGIERAFSIPFVAQLALKEKQIQQNYRPVIAVHKWFARRPGTLFRALLLSEFASPPLEESYFRPHELDGLHVADPFMGGGTPLLEANQLGCDVSGWDINPMSYWIVRQEIQHLGLDAYRNAAKTIEARLRDELGRFYHTRCTACGTEAPVKYFLWVKCRSCVHCGKNFDLFPGYLLAASGRHPKDVLICRRCGALNEADDREHPGICHDCEEPLELPGPAGRNRCPCPHCGQENSYSDPDKGPPVHRMFALEYHCWECKPLHRGRFFKRPDKKDLRRFNDASRLWCDIEPSFAPDDPIPQGDETGRLLRWGYKKYHQMFNERQLLGLEILCHRISEIDDKKTRHALATNLSDLLRYQNMLCRYDTSALKSLDIFSVHGFPVGLIQCESNLFGIQNPKTGASIGSGGWSNIVEKFLRAKQYCEEPFEITYRNGKKLQIPMSGEGIGEQWSHNGTTRSRRVTLHCGSSTQATLPEDSLDAVFTDPPYFANVQYAELMDFCYVWLRRLVDGDDPAFSAASTRNADELTGNATMERDLAHFTAGLSEVFHRMTRALKPGAPLAFTYHHNKLEAYYPIAVAILDAGLVCSASLPCPAEMGGSIHIHSTNSSIIDSVFVCRTTGKIYRKYLAGNSEDIARLINREVEFLRQGGVRVTQGDIRCISFGHLTRLAIWRLRHLWDAETSWDSKLALVGEEIGKLGGFEGLEQHLDDSALRTSRRSGELRETAPPYGDNDEISF